MWAVSNERRAQCLTQADEAAGAGMGSDDDEAGDEAGAHRGANTILFIDAGATSSGDAGATRNGRPMLSRPDESAPNRPDDKHKSKQVLVSSGHHGLILTPRYETSSNR